MKQTFFGTEYNNHGSVLMIGLPFASGISFHKETRQSPDILRMLSSPYEIMKYGIWDKESNESILQNIQLTDFGNINHNTSLEVSTYFSRISKIYESFIIQNKISFSIAGDQHIVLPIITGLARKLNEIQILHLDAHMDYLKIIKGCEPNPCNFIGFIENIPQVKKIIQIGVRGYAVTEQSTTTKIYKTHTSNLSSELIDDIPLYITIDTDAFDLSIFPAVNYPVPGSGLQLDDLNNIMKAILDKKVPIIGADWTEYNPALDTKHLITGQHIVYGIISILKALQQISLTNTHSKFSIHSIPSCIMLH